MPIITDKVLNSLSPSHSLQQCGEGPCDQSDLPKEKVTRVSSLFRRFFVTSWFITLLANWKVWEEDFKDNINNDGDDKQNSKSKLNSRSTRNCWKDVTKSVPVRLPIWVTIFNWLRATIQFCFGRIMEAQGHERRRVLNWNSWQRTMWCGGRSERNLPNGLVHYLWCRALLLTAFQGLRNMTDACDRHDPCQHEGICISTDAGPICECRNAEYEGLYCERGKSMTWFTY